MLLSQTYHGSVIWLTGLSGAGKSTIANEIAIQLKFKNLNTLILDGDEVRKAINDPNCGHDHHSRLQNAYRIARLAQIASKQGHIVTVATMSMFHEIHAWNRSNLPNYFEVYLDVNVSTILERDSKGIYKKFNEGLEQNIPGIDLKAEYPEHPHLVLNNNPNSATISEHANSVINNWLREFKYSVD